MNLELIPNNDMEAELAKSIVEVWNKADEQGLEIDQRIELLVGALVFLKGKIIDF